MEGFELFCSSQLLTFNPLNYVHKAVILYMVVDSMIGLAVRLFDYTQAYPYTTFIVAVVWKRTLSGAVVQAVHNTPHC